MVNTYHISPVKPPEVLLLRSWIFYTSPLNCVLFYEVLENSQNCLANLILKKVQRASENVLTGTFLPPGSGLATPGLQGNDKIEWNAGC